MNTYHRAVFPNGVRAVSCRIEGDVAYAGVLVGAGSRDEGPGREGLAHFVEHTIFKGTRRRRSWHISNRMEQIGGELNAYTTKEETMIYTNAPVGYMPRALDLLSDLVRNASFPQSEIEKEREVIIEEIHSYQDSPADSVYDEFEELIYSGSALSHNILGSPESVRGLGQAEALEFIRDNYRPENIVVYCCDSGDPERNLRLVEKYFGDMVSGGSPLKRVPGPSVPVFNEVRERDSHQANTIVGARVFGRTDPRRHALFLLNNYLGGPCMNSRFNQEMRERRGLVYTVESSVGLLSDTGLWLAYFGSDADAVKRCSAIVERDLDRLAQSPMKPAAFEKIRGQYCGQLIVGSAFRENRCMSLAKSILYYGEVHDFHHTEERIRAVTPEELTEMARLILSSGLSRLTLV